MVKDKPLIHTAEEHKDEPHYHNVSGENFFEGSRITNLLFVIKQLKGGCTVCGKFQNIAYLESETIIGLASIFYLKCICDNINAMYHIKCGENRECEIFQSAENHGIFPSIFRKAVVETVRVRINVIPFIFFEADVRSFEFRITA